MVARSRLQLSVPVLDFRQAKVSTTSRSFSKEYKPFLKYGITSLYGTIGYPWPTKLDFGISLFIIISIFTKWGKTDTYQRLLNLSLRFEDSFVITSNADGFSLKMGLAKIEF